MRARNVYAVMILFLVQSFAASLVTIPTNFDLEEGSSDIQNTNARNNSSCGQDPALTNLIAYTDSTIYYYQGQAVSTTYLADCTVNGKDYELHAYVSGQSSNPWSDYDVWNWTETDASELIYDGWANLPVDTYCWNASLYVISGTSLQYVDVEYGCFDVVASNNSGGGNNSGNNSGGGNNSGNNTGGGNNANNTCGNDPNLTDLMVYIDPSAYVNSGDPVYAYYDINCTIPNKNYTLEVSLSNSTGYYNVNSWNWYETNSYEYISEIWFNLNPGQYCVNATLWDVSNGAMNYVDVEYPCFTTTASNNGGGNNGGGNNSGNNTGGGNNTNNTCGNDPNLTDLMAYINPSAYVNSGFTYANYDINCTIPNTNYTLEVSLSNNTGYYSTNSWNWYETNNYEYIYEEWFNLNPGQYCVNATLWDVSNGAMNYVDGEYPCFTITASNNGGNNNGGGNNSMNGNNSGNNTGGGNNTNNSCGNGSMYNDLITAINPNNAPQGITIVGNYYVDCTVIGESYVLEATTIGQNVQFYDYEVWNWTETNNYESMVDYFYNLIPGYYCTNVTLMLTTGGAQQILDIDYHCFTITNSSGSGNNTGNNTGGGNNSGNNTGGGNNTNNTCGNDPNLTDLMVYIDPSAYVNSGDPVYAYYDINCTIPNTNYTLEVSLSNSTGYYNLNSWNWYENDNYEHISEIWFNLNPGQYCVNATLWDVSNGAMNYVDVEYPCFTITVSNNGGGNNGGGNNSGNNTGGGNNTNNTCGNDPSLTNLMVWTDMTTYQYGDLVTSNYFVDCTIPGKTYELHVDAYSAAWGDYLIFSWNENNDYEDLYNVWQNLDNGTYCVRTTLYEIGGNGHQYLDYGETCFVVVANNNGGGNNNNNTCGNDPSLTDLMIWTDMTTYQVGDVVMSEYYVNCSINGKHYELHVHSYGINSNSWNDYTVWNWTETDQYEIFNNYWQNLSIGSYCINATLYEVSGGAYQYIDMEFTCFDVVGNPNGGGSVDPCGLNASYSQVYEWTDATIYNLGDDQNITFYVNCTRVGASYYLEYFVYEVGSTFGPLTYGFSWTANSISTNHYATLTGLSAGDYCILSELSEPYPNLLTSSSGSTCFTIVAPNQPPYLLHTQQLPYTYANDPLNCYHQGMYYNDPENDPDQSIFTWYINNVQISTGILNNVLPAGITSLGDDVVCEAIAHDGISQGNTVVRWFAVIPANNSAPTVSAVTISPTSPEEGDTLTCSYTYNDPENDPDASLIQWSINSVAIPTATTNSISTGFAAGDFVTCTVTANDGTVSGNTNTGTVLILTEGSGGSVPSIGFFGTIVALGAGFVLFSRRKLQ